MNGNFADEIASHIRHNDFSLAVRRMLDLTLDIGEPEMIREAINWSRDYRIHEKKQPGDQPAESFFKKAEELLARARQAELQSPSSGFLLIEADNISKTYSKGNFSLYPISVSIEAGEIFGIVGENGHGKTTLLRCLAGQLALDRGRLTYNLLSHPDHYAIKNHIAFIPQRIPRWYGRLKDNLHFSAAINGIKGSRNELMVDLILERFNLTHFAELNWNQISSGYRTRFEIARILLQKPRLLILDEPLANLDINAQQTILTDLQYLAKSAYNPMGIFLSSQQLHEVEKVADVVLFIKNGKCLYENRKESVVQQKSYAVEIETPAGRDAILQILGAADVEIQFNGGYYTLTSTKYPAQEMITKLIAHNTPVTYFRDITYSTKRFF